MRPVLLPLLALGALLCGCGPRYRADTLLILGSGHTQGYLENCGCSGGQIGGMARRGGYVRLAREDAAQGRSGEPQAPDGAARMPGTASRREQPPGGGPAPPGGAQPDPLKVETLLIDCGSFVLRGDGLRELESGAVIEAMGLLGYDAVGIGQAELEYDQAKLLGLLGQAKLPYTAANLRFERPEKGEDHSAALAQLVRPYIVARRPCGLRVGVVHVVDLNGVYTEGRLKAGYRLEEPIESARDLLAKHRREADLWVISVNCMKFTQLDPVTVAAIPGADIVYGIDVAAIQRQREHDQRRRETDPAALPLPQEQAPKPEGAVPGAFEMGRPMEKGKEMLALAWPLRPAGDHQPPKPWKIYIKEGVMPDERIEAISQALQPKREEYELGLARQAIDLHKQGREHPWFVGHETCAQCHADIAARLADSKHMHAYATLEAKGRQHSSCAKCHTLGYNRPSGWNALEDREQESLGLRNVQCENCHGPGEYHVMLRSGQPPPEDLQRRGRNAEGLIPASAATCKQCHDHENSPRFQYLTYWPKIVHGDGVD